MKCLCFLFTCLLVKPGIPQVPAAAYPSAYNTVGVYSVNFTDVFSFTANQASLAETTHWAVGLYTDRKYLLKELKRISVATSFPVLNGGAGVTAGYYGFAGYNETQAGIAYGRRLGEKFYLGVQFNYYGIRIPGYGNDGTVHFEIGSIVRLTDKIQVGCHVFNPVGGTFGRNAAEKTASRYSFGAGYEASEKLFISSTVMKAEHHDLDVNVSIHYAFIRNFFVRAGINSASASYFAGAGISWKACRMDIAVSSHPQTGATPGIMLIFSFPQNQELQE